jgi:predicted solute-binding protein
MRDKALLVLAVVLASLAALVTPASASTSTSVYYCSTGCVVTAVTSGSTVLSVRVDAGSCKPDTVSVGLTNTSNSSVVWQKAVGFGLLGGSYTWTSGFPTLPTHAGLAVASSKCWDGGAIIR